MRGGYIGTELVLFVIHGTQSQVHGMYSIDDLYIFTLGSLHMIISIIKQLA